MKWTLMSILVIIIFVLLSACYGVAEEDFDYRSDVQSFCNRISEINAEIYGYGADNGKKLFRTTKSVMVIFQTQKVPLDFSEADFEMSSVIYGPRGFSVLVCTEPSKAVEWLLQQDGVLYAEIDMDVSGCSGGDESGEVSLHSWAAATAGYEEYIRFAKRYGSGSCTVAVIDSGTFRHSLIIPKLRTGGHDYIDNDNDSTNDLNGHGTRVAGIIADCTQGLPVYIYPIRVLDADANGKTSNVICAILEATEAHVDIINLSLATFTHSELLENAVRDAISSGIVVVAAAGNYGCDADEVSPACMTDEGIIVVGSADENGTRSSFSNYGSSVDLYFYGRNISSCSRSNGYVEDSGTSMAAPHISALCAMMQLVHPSMSAGSMVSRMCGSSGSSLHIPEAAAMIPRDLGFFINSLTMRTGDTLLLPARALPDTSQETISFVSSDDTVVSIAEGLLTVNGAGSAEITVRCKGFEDSFISVTVRDGDAYDFILPPGLQTVEDEAFYGISTDKVTVPDGVRSIGDQAFDGGSVCFITLPASVDDIGENTFSNAVIFCAVDSMAQTYAIQHGLQYLAVQ